MPHPELRIKISDEKELFALLSEANRIIVNYRYWHQQWKEHFGNTRQNLATWEQRADEYIENLKKISSLSNEKADG